MSWPPPGSKPPVPPRPAPAPTPRPTPVSPPPSPGEKKVKPQATATAPTPPQFGHDGIDPVRAALILGVPVLAAGVALLVMFASPLVWWIAAGVAAAGVAGGVLVRRSGRARGLLKRLPGAGRVTSALRRTPNGRFASSPLGRVFNRALGKRPTSSSGASSSRPKTLGGKLRTLLPPWAGGTRKPSSSSRAGASAKPSRGQRMRSLLNRLKPGGGRRPGGSGSTSPSGAKRKPGGLLGRVARPVGKATGKTSRTVGSKLTRGRPGDSLGSRRRSSNPTGKGRHNPGGPAGAVRHTAGAVARFFGFGAEVVRDALSDTTEAGSKDSCTTTVRGNRHLTRPGTGPSWPKVDQDEVHPVPPPPVRTALDPVWPADDLDEGLPPDYKPDLDDYDDHDDAAEQSSQDERGPDPPASPPASPSSHRETRGEEPRVTSANTKHGGKPMAVSPDMHNDLITSAATRQEGWQAGADAFRRDANRFEQAAKDHDAAAGAFRSTGNITAAERQEDDARRMRADEQTCRVFASKLQEKANTEPSAAA